MKLLSRTFLIGMGLFTMTACSEEFLEQTPEQSLSIENAVEDLVSLRAAVNGVYNNFQTANMYGWDLPLIPDLRGDNAYVSFNNAGRFLVFDEYRLTDQSGRVSGEWNQHYEVIVNTSNIINRFPEATFLSTEMEDANQLLGEAYAQRALTYWNLLRLFAEPYTNDGGASPGVPITNVGTTGEIVTPARESVAAGYAQVVSDFQAAIPLMTENNDGRFTKEAAQALLAKVYLYMEDWSSAESLASEVIASENYSLYAGETEWVSSWGSLGSEDLFAVANALPDNLGTNSIGGILDQDGYGDVLATQDLYDAYAESDFRRSMLTPGSRVSGEEDAIFADGKYPEGQRGADFIRVIRLSDVYLIRAEARAELGDEEGARSDLNAIAQRADTEYDAEDASGEELIEAIIEERRKELAFEGDRVYDLMRRQMTWTKYRNPTLENEEVSWDNAQLINPIPRAELDNNPNINENNPGY